MRVSGWGGNGWVFLGRVRDYRGTVKGVAMISITCFREKLARDWVLVMRTTLQQGVVLVEHHMT